MYISHIHIPPDTHIQRGWGEEETKKREGWLTALCTTLSTAEISFLPSQHFTVMFTVLAI